MSVWAHLWYLSDDDHATACDRWERVGPHTYEERRDRACTCDAGPIAYRASHLNPEVDHGHGGMVDVSYIPDHVYGRRMPYLRVWVEDADGTKPGTVVIIGHDDAVALRDAMSAWIDGEAS